MHSGSSIRRLAIVVLVGFMVACSRENPSTPTPTGNPAATPTKPQISPSPTSPPIINNPFTAEVAEIFKQPVFIRAVNTTQEKAAQQGMGLNLGDTIRTQGQALAQVNLNNGLGFRIGGNASLTLNPDNRLNLTSGEMITWVNPGKKVPTQIVTQAAIAGIRGTTAYVKIPPDPRQGILFFAWEGIVSVRLPGQKEEIFLKTAEEVHIKPGEKDIRAVQRRVRRLSRAEWRRKRQSDRLLHSFQTPLPTLQIIKQIRPGQVNLASP